MKKFIFPLLVLLFSAMLLVTCSDGGNTSNNTGNNDNNSSNIENNNESAQSNNEPDNNNNANQKKNHGDTNEGNEYTASENGDSTDMSDQLKMDEAKTKLPSDFPVDKKPAADITKNTSSKYSVEHQTKSKNKVAAFTGTLYKNADDAASNLDEFMENKKVPENEESGTDLGHDITGYGEGAAGHAYFGWTEGNWTFAIASISADEMNNPDIAKKMVDYLEPHALSAPENEGIVSINYPEGGDSVEVDIRWQEDDMVYQLETDEVPLDALKMTTSVKK